MTMLLLLATARTHDHQIRLKKSSKTAQGVVAVRHTPYTRLMGILELFLVSTGQFAENLKMHHRVSVL